LSKDLVAGPEIETAGFTGLEAIAGDELALNRKPQNPGAGSVNSNSTYPLAPL
jgi:hypothetical protein